jgi:hypothetical protein
MNPGFAYEADDAYFNEMHAKPGYVAFLSKFDSSGNYHWARTQDASSGYSNSRGVAADVFGNTYMIGFFSGTVGFDPGSGVDNHTSNGGLDAFLTKFDPNGNW